MRDRLSQRFGVAPKGDAVEKAYSIDGDVEAGSRKLALGDQMVKPVDNLLVRDSALASADRNVRVQRRICVGSLQCVAPDHERSGPGCIWAIMPTTTSLLAFVAPGLRVAASFNIRFKPLSVRIS
ncbi:MAG: hypothetical protein JO232_08420 [Verrucomicrobia bacterium]|nr:hypothetical protein [Verrucomicrobiota bacterium]